MTLRMKAVKMGNEMQRVPRYGCHFARVQGQGSNASVSQYMSPEGRLAMLASRRESSKVRQKIQPKALSTALKPSSTDVAQVTGGKEVGPDQDGESSVEVLGFAEALERICTTRLHGDITDRSYTPKETRRRVLGGGDRLHNALEVVEIVRHRDCDEEDNDNRDSNHSDDDDEEEVIQRKANLSSMERCLVWVELHQFVDDWNRQSSATCSGS